MSPWCRVDYGLADRLPELGAATAMVAIRLARYTNGDGEAWPAISTLAATTGLSERSVRRAIRRLVDAGLLIVQPRTTPGGTTASNLYRLVYSPQEQADTTDALPCHERQGEGSCGVRGRVTREHPEQEPIEQEPLNKKETRVSSRFVKPTLQEVAAYCRERRNSIDPEAFVAHYQSKGWKVGKEPMKDWKAAVITWERRQDKFATTTGQQQNPAPIKYLNGR